MKLRTRVKLAIGITVCVFLVYGAALLFMDRTMAHLAQEVQNANELSSRISLLRTLSLDNLVYQTERSRRQWAAVYGEVRHLLVDKVYLDLQLEYGLGDIGDKVKIIGDTFQKLLGMPGPERPDDPEGEIRRELRNRLTTQLLLTTHDLLTRFDNLRAEVHQDLIRTQRLASGLNILALLSLGLIILSAGFFLQRSVLQPVLKLHEGAEVIGAGNLDYKVGINTRDEIGQLSQSFDRMTANLRKVTVSRDELLREMAERKQVEESLRESREDLNRAQAVAHVGSWRLNVRKNELTWSDETYRIFGIPRGTPLTYKIFLGTIHLEDRKYVEDEWTAALKGKPYDIEHRIIADGMVKWVRERAELEFDHDGRLLGGFGTVQDITERKRIEEALEGRSAELSRAVSELEETNAEMERFTYMISHDLKSPLVTISTFLRYLEEDLRQGNSDRIDKDLRFIGTAAKKMGQLLSELLEMSRIGRVVNAPVEVTFKELAEEALQSLAGPISERGVGVQTSPEDIILFGDRPRLVEIWQNLVENAVKYMGEQAEPRLSLGFQQQGEDTVFTVCDNGVGIDPKYQNKIFGLFEKLDSKTGGTGIGLAIVKRIVELYQGKIWVESAGLGQGACFRFTLPEAVKRAK